ncbi:MAG: peroxiredoxin family protein [Actinomycetota bacterium]|nr:peroxiredoxin family protein [Actinomycetota bacterium]
MALPTKTRGNLAKPYGLPDDKEGVAVPSIVVVDRKGTVPSLYSDRGFANGPGDEEIFEALEGMTKADQSESDASGAVENWTSADNTVESTVRPDRSLMTLDVVTPTIGASSFPPSPSKGGSALSLRVPPSGKLTVISRWARSTGARPINETK